MKRWSGAEIDPIHNHAGWIYLYVFRQGADGSDERSTKRRSLFDESLKRRLAQAGIFALD